MLLSFSSRKLTPSQADVGLTAKLKEGGKFVDLPSTAWPQKKGEVKEQREKRNVSNL